MASALSPPPCPAGVQLWEEGGAGPAAQCRGVAEARSPALAGLRPRKRRPAPRTRRALAQPPSGPCAPVRRAGSRWGSRVPGAEGGIVVFLRAGSGALSTLLHANRAGVRSLRTECCRSSLAKKCEEEDTKPKKRTKRRT